ncbi:LPS-induced tumor necrosis factor alpha factor [Akanthomyces lecanii RCEF 1005]|uniref:LPS-induced tumor necrosis factor alpha factor n=1 Tax=Akanthomyces lecanii RCEF 1005 TaxID=1081108 RepID=A0A167YIN4_CORDF|nr:LPS-induced tumor necrosis factor alpha factor [Akanthomyces lecanii RCEF 1005]
MSKEQSHELQEQQQQCELPHDQPQQSQQQLNSQHGAPTEPQPAHNHMPIQETATEVHPPSYEQAKASPAGQPPASLTPGQAPTTVTPLNQLGDTPQWIDCPFCHKRTKTTDTDWHCSECKKKVAIRQNEGAIQVLGPTQVVYSQYGNQNPMNNPQQLQGPGQNVQHPDVAHQQQPQAVPGQNTYQSMPQHPDASQQQSHEIQPQPLQAPSHPPVDVKN